MFKIRWRRVLLGLLLCLLVRYGFLLTRIYAYSSQGDAAPADEGYFYASYLLRRPFRPDLNL